MKPKARTISSALWCVLVCLAVGGCMGRQSIKVNEHTDKKLQNASWSGGSGNSYDSAVVLTGGKDQTVAIQSERAFIAKLWGEQDKDWKISEQTTVSEAGKTFDMVQVELLKTNEKHFYYFDISWYGKKAKRPQEPIDAQ